MFQRIGRPLGSGSRKQRSREIQYAQYFVERMDHRDLFPVAQSVAQLLHHLAGIFRERASSPPQRFEADRGQKTLAEDPGKEDRYGA